MKKLSLLVFSALLVVSCSKDIQENTPETNLTSQDLLSVEQVNNYIQQQLESQGDVVWKDAPAQLLWSAVMHSEGVLSVGYGEAGESYAETRSPRLLADKQNAITIAMESEGSQKKQDLVLDADPLFNVVDMQIANLETIENLQEANNIRYLDPIGYNKFGIDTQKSGSGCNQNSVTINRADYTPIAPGSWRPWNFDTHNIDDAWAYSTGDGVTVGLIDTGLSSSQPLLGSNFNDDYSNGRFVQKYGTYIDSVWWWSNNLDGPNDRCGHGTQMASALAAPRTNDNMPVGVAYNSNLVSYRGTSDVLLNDYHERKGVSNALRALGQRGDVKVISMSIGYVWSIGNVRDAVRYAHARGKMIVAAGGTSTSFTNWYGVIFPANMNETVAVTGVKENGVRCNNCHSGNKIDFTIVMQRTSSDSRTVPVLGFNNGTRNYVGGSSVATAMTAGIAALIWEQHPNWNRDQVFNKMKQASANYPNRNAQFGYGNIDALQAVQ